MFFINCILSGSLAKILPLKIKNGGSTNSSIYIQKISLINNSIHCFNNTLDVPTTPLGNSQFGPVSHLWYFRFFKLGFTVTDVFTGVEHPLADAYQQGIDLENWDPGIEIDNSLDLPYDWNPGTGYLANTVTGWTISNPFILGITDVFTVNVSVVPGLISQINDNYPSSDFPNGGIVNGQHTAKMVIDFRLSPNTETLQQSYNFVLNFNTTNIDEMDFTDFDVIFEVDNTNVANILDVTG
tara:strand:- start:498 stop:1217 length:720 start_codon:yes stop_codon:yes gene_type:complete